MKLVKRKLTYIFILALLGISFVILGITRELNVMLISFGIAEIAISVAKFIQYYRIFTNEDKRKQYEMTQNEERLIFIVDKSRSLTFFVALTSEFIAMIILMIMNHSFAANIVGFAIASQGLLYILIYYYFNKKY